MAEEFHLSTPSITRSMQHLEQYFGVPLFTRGKNRIELNETGKLAVAAARKLCVTPQHLAHCLRGERALAHAKARRLEIVDVEEGDGKADPA